MLKREVRPKGPPEWLRGLGPSRARMGFERAVRLCERGLATAWPLAALERRQAGSLRESVLVTEYVDGAVTLHEYVADRAADRGPRRAKWRDELGRQVVELLAGLWEAGYWHRDAKASNLLVQDAAGGPRVILVDLDGLRRHVVAWGNVQFRGPTRLAASLLWSGEIATTDYLRVFKAYAERLGVRGNGYRRAFREASKQALASRWLTAAVSAMDAAEARPVRRMQPAIKAQCRRILIIKPSALGDVVMALPAFRALRAGFPDARIEWLVRPEYAPLLERVRGLDGVVLFDRKRLGKWWYDRASFQSLMSFRDELRQGGYDLVVDFQGLFRTAFFAWLTGSPRRVGPATAREFGSAFYTHRVRQDDGSVHVIDYYRKIAAAAGAAMGPAEYGLTPKAQDVTAAEAALRREGIAGGGYAVFVTGSAHQRKCWPGERFAALAERMTRELGLAIVAIGTAGERAMVDAWRSKASVPVANLAGATDLGGLLGVLHGARVVVSNDTGPGHIAVGLGRPVVMLLGPTNPRRLRPYGQRDSLVLAVPEDDWGCEIGSSDPRCGMENITVEAVYECVRRRLEGGV